MKVLIYKSLAGGLLFTVLSMIHVSLLSSISIKSNWLVIPFFIIAFILIFMFMVANKYLRSLSSKVVKTTIIAITSIFSILVAMSTVVDGDPEFLFKMVFSFFVTYTSFAFLVFAIHMVYNWITKGDKNEDQELTTKHSSNIL